KLWRLPTTAWRRDRTSVLGANFARPGGRNSSARSPRRNRSKESSMSNLAGRRVAVLLTDGFEQVEMTEPRKALEGAGAQVDLVAPESGQVQGWNHTDPADAFPVDRTLAEVSADDYQAVLLPGGVVNADTIRVDDKAQALVKDFEAQGKPIFVICHGAWLLASAGLVK